MELPSQVAPRRVVTSSTFRWCSAFFLLLSRAMYNDAFRLGAGSSPPVMLPKELRVGGLTFVLAPTSRSTDAVGGRRVSESCVHTFCFVGEWQEPSGAIFWYYSPLEDYDRKKIRVDEHVVIAAAARDIPRRVATASPGALKAEIALHQSDRLRRRHQRALGLDSPREEEDEEAQAASAAGPQMAQIFLRLGNSSTFRQYTVLDAHPRSSSLAPAVPTDYVKEAGTARHPPLRKEGSTESSDDGCSSGEGGDGAEVHNRSTTASAAPPTSADTTTVYAPRRLRSTVPFDAQLMQKDGTAGNAGDVEVERSRSSSASSLPEPTGPIATVLPSSPTVTPFIATTLSFSTSEVPDFRPDLLLQGSVLRLGGDGHHSSSPAPQSFSDSHGKPGEEAHETVTYGGSSWVGTGEGNSANRFLPRRPVLQPPPARVCSASRLKMLRECSSTISTPCLSSSSRPLNSAGSCSNVRMSTEIFAMDTPFTPTTAAAVGAMASTASEDTDWGTNTLNSSAPYLFGPTKTTSHAATQPDVPPSARRTLSPTAQHAAQSPPPMKGPTVSTTQVAVTVVPRTPPVLTAPRPPSASVSSCRPQRPRLSKRLTVQPSSNLPL